MMKRPFNPQRRQFIKVSTTAGAGFALAFVMPGGTPVYADSTNASHWEPNAWLMISADSEITIMLSKAEMGQGVMTALPMILAEELAVDWQQVRVKQAPVDPAYGNQLTGGSASVRQGWKPLRQAGATAREMLVLAAASTWHVPVSECRAEKGAVIHRSSNRRAKYGELIDVAARMPIPNTVALKDEKDFKFIGHPIPRLDIPSKVNGQAVFGIDVQLPDLLTATLTHCPVFGGKWRNLDSAKALRIPGVRQVVVVGNDAVAVVAEDFWTAKKGRDALEIEWDFGPHRNLSSEELRAQFAADVDKAAEVARNEGDVSQALVQASKTVQADYETPYEAHATLEPMNCTAYVHNGECEIWVPTQNPESAQGTARQHAFSTFERLFYKAQRYVLGTDPVKVHQTLLGGGFGRRLRQDFVAEAVQIAKAVGTPVKLIWTREEDMQHDYYHPATYHRLSAGLDSQGMPIAWDHRIAGRGIKTYGAEELAYSIPNIRIASTDSPASIPIGAWRSVAHSYSAFAIECFMDELAAEAQHDPLDYRLKLLGGNPRLKQVLELIADKANWGANPPEGRYRGLAVHEAFNSYAAQIAEVSLEGKGGLKIHRVVCGIDCGIAVNPDTIRAQLEGSIAWGLTAAIKGAISIKDGRVEQSNFHDFPLLSIAEMPAVETLIVPSQEPPSGVGEPGVPPLAPAIANALYAASGKRVRHLPLSLNDLMS
jgi:isoquinoline 1-oxidoreductase beta subunit